MRLFFDIEVYRNYFLALFMREDGQCKRFEIFNDDRSAFPRSAVLGLMTHPDVELVGFNSDSYDLPLLTYALTHPVPKDIKRESDRIIQRNIRSWQFYRDEGLQPPDVNHIDLIEVAPGMVGLKIYGGRLGSKKLQELPIEHTATIEPEQVELLRQYCKNDTTVTQLLHSALSKQIDLRRAMSKEYGVDLRSKSDAQIAEAVLKAEFTRLTKQVAERVPFDKDSFYYKPPAYIRFATPELQHVLETVRTAEMVVKGDTGHVIMPKAIEALKIEIGQSAYKIGIGGLHSKESETAHFTDEDNVLIDRDVESYYPRMMLNMNMRPGGFGEHFNTVYGKILDERLEAKHSGNKVKSDSLKIVLNGTFGKTSNRYSTLYSPDFMIRTTLTGQLTILMLIEALERYGIPVVSANTDGIVIKCPRSELAALDVIIEKWERHTGLKTEETRYRALYSRDVNNYIAVKEDGSAKAKGVFGPTTLSKNPQSPICNEAVIAYLTQGIPVEDTVRTCKDITKFLTLRTVNGGAIKDDERLGKAIRWYYAEGEGGAIHYATNGNTVPRTEGAKPLMDLPERFPSDVNYEWYIRECEEILMAVGAVPRPVLPKLPRKNSKAWKELHDTGQIVENHKGKWTWANP
jgi:DNA polymerase elongation subunit (family B)